MLTGKQRSYLRALGNELDPVVIIGKSGVSREIINQFEDALEARELVKGRLLPKSSDSVDTLCRQIAGQVNAEIVQIIGNNFLLFRQSVKKPRIVLPE